MSAQTVTNNDNILQNNYGAYRSSQLLQREGYHTYCSTEQYWTLNGDFGHCFTCYVLAMLSALCCDLVIEAPLKLPVSCPLCCHPYKYLHCCIQREDHVFGSVSNILLLTAKSHAQSIANTLQYCLSSVSHPKLKEKQGRETEKRKEENCPSWNRGLWNVDTEQQV